MTSRADGVGSVGTNDITNRKGTRSEENVKLEATLVCTVAIFVTRLQSAKETNTQPN